MAANITYIRDTLKQMETQRIRLFAALSRSCFYTLLDIRDGSHEITEAMANKLAQQLLGFTAVWESCKDQKVYDTGTGQRLTQKHKL